MLLTRLRRLAQGSGSGYTPVLGPVDMAGFEADAAGLSEAGAEIVESPRDGLRAIPVGSPEGSAFTCFLDGIQQADVALYRDGVPIVYAYAAAVVRVRRAGRMSTFRGSPGDVGSAGRAAFTTRAAGPAPSGAPYVVEREAAIFPFRFVDPAEIAAAVPDVSVIDSGQPDDEPLPLFPPLLYARAAAAVNRLREGLEAGLARRWCAEAPAGEWLLVDGSLTLCPELAACGRAVGVIKSHRTRFFDGDDARILLGLEVGERTCVFRPLTREHTPVYSWYLRLRSPAGRDGLWGLVRVEAAADPSTLERADEISRWILAETVPLPLPDPRWDRLLYPIRNCEEYLRSRAPGL